MRYHIDVLGRLHGVWGFFGLLTGCSLFILAFGIWTSLATVNPGTGAVGAAIWILIGTGLTLVLAGLAMIATGRGVRRHRPAGRLAALILSLPNLVLVPFGTALGIYALWVLLNDDARHVFGRPPRLASSVPTSMEEDV